MAAEDPTPAKRLQARAASLTSRSLASADATISHLNRLLATSANVDTALLTLAYTLHLAHATLARVTAARLQLAARAVVQRLAAVAPHALLPGETVVATLAPAPSSRLARTQSGVRALAAVVDDFRVFGRLWGLLRIWAWAARLARNPPADRVARVVQWAQVLACAGLQYLENRAYLASKGVLGRNGTRVGRWYKWSARLWAAHVLLEFVRLAREAALQREEERCEWVDEDDKVGKAERSKRAAAWWRDIYVNAAWLPLTVHWSMEEGFAGEGLIAALGLVPGILGLKAAWKACE